MSFRIPTSLRHWMSEAEAAYGPSMDEWFPADFDWKALCADAPALAERLGQTWKPATAAAAKARLEELGQAAFRGAYVGALSILAACDVDADPKDALERLVAPLSDEEAETMGDDLARDLEVVEARLAGEEPSDPGTERADVASTVAAPVREGVRAVLTDGLAGGASALVSLGASTAALSKVLAGLVSVAVSLACLRWALAIEADALGGVPTLAIDPGQLQALLPRETPPA